MYEIIWQPKAARQIEKITDKTIRANIFSAVFGLTDFPDCQNIKALKNHKYSFRLRVGRFRIFFNVQKSVQIINITEVKKRDEQTY